MKQKQLGILIMVIAAITFSAAIILMKVIPESTRMEPAHVAIWRFTIAAPVYWMVSLFRSSQSQVAANHRWRFMLAGLVFSTASFSAVFALSYLPSSIFVIIISISPSLVVLFSLIAGRPVPKLFWFGLPMTMIGLVLTAYEFGTALVVNPVGLVISLINAMAFGGYMLVSEKVFSNVRDRISGTNWVMTGAMITGLSLIPILGLSTPESTFGWLLLFSLGIVGTVVPIYAMNTGLQMIGAARGSIITTLQPVVTVLFSTVFLNESLSIQQWVGGSMVVVAVILLQRSPDRVNRKAESSDPLVLT